MGDNPFEEPSTAHNQRLLNTGGRSYGGSGGYQPREVFGDAFVESGEGGTETFKPELQFQKKSFNFNKDFQHTNAEPSNNRGTINNSGGAGGAIIHPDQSTVVNFEDEPTIAKQPLASGSGGGGGEGNPPGGDGAPPVTDPVPTSKFWTVEYYRPFFNVDTAEVLLRIVRSLTPFRFGFIETAKSNPDFYGPFWISTTLVFLLAMAGNFYSVVKQFINNKDTNPAVNSTSSSSDEWDYNFSVIVVGAAIIYSYTIVLPFILWGVFKYLSVPVKVLEVICIYGYTLFVFIPVSFCLPFLAFSEIAQWVVIMAACGWSGFFLVSNLLVTVKDIAFKRGLLAMVCVGAIHAALGLTYKLYFFSERTYKH